MCGSGWLGLQRRNRWLEDKLSGMMGKDQFERMMKEHMETTAKVKNAGYDGSQYVDLQSGDISSIIAGAGLTGGGSSGDITLNVGQGTGIAVTADVPNDDPMAITITDEPLYGTATISGFTIVYTSDPTFTGTETFDYTVTNLVTGCNVTNTVTVTVS